MSHKPYFMADYLYRQMKNKTLEHLIQLLKVFWAIIISCDFRGIKCEFRGKKRDFRGRNRDFGGTAKSVIFEE